MNSTIYIIGSGGHANVVARTAQLHGLETIFIWSGIGNKPLGKFVAEEQFFSSIPTGDSWRLICGIGSVASMESRAAIIRKYAPFSHKFISLAHPAAIVDETAEIANGVFIGPGAIVANGSKIGKHAIINSGAIIEHNSEVGENTHVATGAVILGAAKVGFSTLIGASATVLQTKKIGSSNIVGAGSVCTKDIPDQSGTWVGAPAACVRGQS